MAGSCEEGYELSACMKTVNLLTIRANISVQKYPEASSECKNVRHYTILTTP